MRDEERNRTGGELRGTIGSGRSYGSRRRNRTAGGSRAAGMRMGSGKTGKGKLELRIKICIAIIILIIILNAVSPAVLEKIKNRSGASKDYKVKEVMSMAVSGFYEAKEAVSGAVATLSDQEVDQDKAAVEDKIDLDEVEDEPRGKSKEEDEEESEAESDEKLGKEGETDSIKKAE